MIVSNLLLIMMKKIIILYDKEQLDSRTWEPVIANQLKYDKNRRVTFLRKYSFLNFGGYLPI